MSHIALLLPELEAGGAQRVMLLLAREFSSRGHQVDLVLLHAVGPLLNSVPKGVRLVDLGAQNRFGQIGFFFSSSFRLARWLRRARPDVLLSSITGANLAALLARKIARAPLRIVVREAVTLKNIRSTLRLGAMRWLYPQAEALIALSTVMASELVEQIGVSVAKIHCVANPVDIESVQKQASAPLNHPWLDDDQLKAVISVGRLVPQKDYPTLLRAFALLPRESCVRLIIVGEGIDRLLLERLIVELNIEDRVQLAGFDANPWRWMARADLFVLSSRWEGHPNALLEAVTLGLPSVVTEYDDSVREMAGKYPVTVVPVGQAEQMAKAISSALVHERVWPCEDMSSVTKAVDGYLAVLFPAAINSANNDS